MPGTGRGELSTSVELSDDRTARPRGDPGELRHHPALDGLRGFAVLLVLCFHGSFSWASGGFLGVSLSFLFVERPVRERRALRAWRLPADLLVVAAVVALGGTLVASDRADGISQQTLRKVSRLPQSVPKALSPGGDGATPRSPGGPTTCSASGRTW